MWNQFFLENGHFAIDLTAALCFFTVFWLYLDSWTESRRAAEVWKFLGFLLLSLSFLGQAVWIESTIVPSSLFNGAIQIYFVPTLRLLGYLFTSLGIFLDPLQPHPKSTALIAFVGLSGGMYRPDFLYPVLAAMVGLLYLRRATIGLETHLKKVSLSFFVLSVSELFGLSFAFRQTANITIYNLVAPFGLFWILQQLFLILAAVILLKWSFTYLFKRFNTQIFIILDSAILVIFLITAVSFTALLIKNIQDETFDRLGTDVKVLSFALESKKAESLSDAQIVAIDSRIVADITNNDRSKLATDLEEFLLTKKDNFLMVTDGNGKVLARGEDRSSYGDLQGNDLLVKRALLGVSASSVGSKDSALAPIISVRSAVPIKAEGKIIGVVVTGITLDNAFLDGVKSSTGLEASIYSGNILSATTLTTQGGKVRPIGIKEVDKSINNYVLGKGENFTTRIMVLNVDYLASYSPLNDLDNNTIGMIFVGKPQVGILRSAGQSIELTFGVTAMLLIISILPSYFVSKYLSDQLN